MFLLLHHAWALVDLQVLWPKCIPSWCSTCEGSQKRTPWTTDTLGVLIPSTCPWEARTWRARKAGVPARERPEADLSLCLPEPPGHGPLSHSLGSVPKKSENNERQLAGFLRDEKSFIHMMLWKQKPLWGMIKGKVPWAALTLSFNSRMEAGTTEVSRRRDMRSWPPIPS